MPAVASGRAAERIRKVLARKNIPIPVIAHASITAQAEAFWDMFCGRLNIPPPTMALTTSDARAITPSFLSFPAMMRLLYFDPAAAFRPRRFS